MSNDPYTMQEALRNFESPDGGWVVDVRETVCSECWVKGDNLNLKSLFSVPAITVSDQNAIVVSSLHQRDEWHQTFAVGQDRRHRR